MAIREQGNGKRSKLNAEGLTPFFQEIADLYPLEAITFLCIGTDRSTGDALGPLTGSKLLEYGFPHVIGTLPSPCDADNLLARMAGIPVEHTIIAIDACLGPPIALGCFLASNEPLQPAQSMGLHLPAVGHFSLAAVVDINGPKPYQTLQTTPLYRVMSMADHIAKAAVTAFGMNPLGDSIEAIRLNIK